MIRFIAEHRDHQVPGPDGGAGLRWGVEPMCEALSKAGTAISASTYYEWIAKQPTGRQLRDAELVDIIAAQRADKKTGKFVATLGSRKLWIRLRGQGHDVARCTVERIMGEQGWEGARYGSKHKTTIQDESHSRFPDRVDRNFHAPAPNRLWVADITYVRTFTGWVYCAFVLDVFSRRVVGWQVSTSLRTDLALDALNMGLWTRHHDGHDTSALVHHSDRGVQYLAIRYTERLGEAGAVASVGSNGDAYDNAMAEAFNSLFKAELVRNLGPWKSIDDLEIAVAKYIDWFNFRRLHGEIGLIPPVEFEDLHRSTALPEQPAQRQFPVSIKPGT